MKHLLAAVALLLCFVSQAQSPALINYQGVARDSNGAPVVSQNISLRFDIRKGSPSGQIVYTDVQQGNVATGALGLFNTQIGKTPGMDTVSWSGGSFYLEVSLDATGGNSFISMGTQQMVSVPFALMAKNVPASINGNVLTIGTTTVALGSVSLTSAGIVSVTNNGGGNFSVGAVTPTLTGLGSASVTGTYPNYTITTPAAASPTFQGTGLATVASPTTGNYNVHVPVPTFNPANGMLAFGNTSVNTAPTLTMVGGILTSGPFSNSVVIPQGVTVSQGPGIASVLGGPNYTISVPAPVLGLSANGQSLGISGGNTITLPTAYPQGTVTHSGLAQVTSAGINTFNVHVPLPTYNSNTGLLSFTGTNTLNIIPSLSLTAGTLFSGPLSNSVSLANIGVWRQGAGSVTLATASDKVGIGTNSPGALLDVQGSTGFISTFINSSATNSNPAVYISSQGPKALSAHNNNSGGIAGEFIGNGGLAIFASNNSPFYTFQSVNSNTTLSAYAGYFEGGFIAQGKNNPSAGNLIVSARNHLSQDVFVVRNDGNVGIGNNTPGYKLDISSTGVNLLSLTTTGANSNVNVDANPTGNGNLQFAVGGGTNNGVSFVTNFAQRMKIGGNGFVGIGTSSPTATLHVNGSMRLSDGSEGNGKVLTSDGQGNATWQSVGSSSANICILKDVKSNNSPGGTFTAGAWRTRDLNTVEGNTSLVALGSNQFTLQAGTYQISANAPAYKCDQNKAKLRNITDGTDAIIGSSEISDSGAFNHSNSIINGIITITSAKVFQIQHLCFNTIISSGFGTATNAGVDEVYTQVQIIKIN